jgi:hypothetical protein
MTSGGRRFDGNGKVVQSKDWPRICLLTHDLAVVLFRKLAMSASE